MIANTKTCPKCMTVFRVSKEQLLAANGALRCGSCFTIFYATSDIEKDGPEVSEEVSKDNQEFHSHGEQDQSSWRELKYRGRRAKFDEIDFQVIDIKDIDDSYHLLPMTQSDSKMSGAWWGISILFLLLGCAQYLYFNFDRYAADPNYRIYATELCALLGCHLADFSDLKSLKVGNLLIRSDPDNPKALIVDAIIQNSAEFRQRFPGIKLEFYNSSSVSMAGRIFWPEEYLDGDFKDLRFIPAGTEVRFSLKILDPGKLAVGYDISVVTR